MTTLSLIVLNNVKPKPYDAPEVIIPVANHQSVAYLIEQFKSVTMDYLEKVVSGLSSPSKMPGYGYSISAFRCKVGSVLRKVEGSTCGDCYACKGNCTRYPAIQQCLERRYQSLSLGSVWVAAMATIMDRKRSKVKDTSVMRWHDSGDIQSVAHLRNLAMVMEFVPHIQGWLPTREYGMLEEYAATYGEFPSNLTVRVSAHMLGKSAPSRFKVSSIVLRPSDALPEGVSQCPAYAQGGYCLDCRNCWSKDIATVAYPIH